MNTKSVRLEFGYRGGTFSDHEISEAREKSIPLTMDCALPGPCLNDCTYCGFLYVNRREKLRQSEILKLFQDFSDLGGRSIKILGEGEPLLKRDILYLLRTINKLGMTPVLFTCGDVLGSEKLAQRFHQRSCSELVQELFEIGVTVILKYEKRDEDDIVQRGGYSILREQALHLLISAGLRNCGHLSRLGFSIVLTKLNYKEIPSVFVFALDNGIYPLVCPLMPIGKMKDPLLRADYSPKPCEIEFLTEKLVGLREERGICFTDDSAFPGGLPCDISRAGMYVDDVGNVKVCEADETVGNIKDNSLENLWNLCSDTKNRKYGADRWRGICFPKIEQGIMKKCQLDLITK